jgi:hypothetical protein
MSARSSGTAHLLERDTEIDVNERALERSGALAQAARLYRDSIADAARRGNRLARSGRR